jgi:putative flippase GtrA
LIQINLEYFGNFLRKVIDFFYPILRRYVSVQFFRYGIVGSFNLLFDWLLYFTFYNYLLQHRMLELNFITLSSHIAALVLKSPIVLLSGFLLQKYVTYSHSNLNAFTQFIRYSVVFVVNLLINYIGLKILVDLLSFWPTPSIMILSIITISFSYFSQKYFSFETIKTNT